MIRRVLLVLLVVALVAAGGTSYALGTGTDEPDYRTTRARTGDVEETLATTGTVDAAHRADLGFGTSGTVARVRVKTGQKVKAGQVLATLEVADLDAAVDEAEAARAQAVARLAADKDGQADAVAASTTTRTQSASRSSSRSPQPAPTPTIDLSGLEAQQQAVLDAQSAATDALASARDALAAQTTACKDAFDQDPAADPAEPPVEDPADQACTDALALVQERQGAAESAQTALAEAIQALTETLTKAVLQVRQAAQQQPQQQPVKQPVASQPQAPSSPTVTAAQLASDQAAIDQAEADLVTAQQAREQATLRSTRAGTVAQLSVAAGDEAEAGSPVVVVVGGNAVTVTAQVAESKVRRLKVGQKVRVSQPGSTQSTTGAVSAIGLVADSSTGTTSYPVTVAVEEPTIPLPTGSSALLEVVTATARDVVTLPVSAVSKDGDRATVRVWDGKELKRRTVTLGAIGGARVQVKDGLKVGEQVVLADKAEDIDGASSSLNDQGGRFGPGRLPDGVRPPMMRQGG